jgi:hypothetical protein
MNSNLSISNLPKNLYKAFERRFLHKIYFDHPMNISEQDKIEAVRISEIINKIERILKRNLGMLKYLEGESDPILPFFNNRRKINMFELLEFHLLFSFLSIWLFYSSFTRSYPDCAPSGPG